MSSRVRARRGSAARGARRSGGSFRRDAAVPRRAASPTAAELYAALDAIAPFAHAAEWDNVGLLAGSLDWPAGRVLLTIDLTDAVAREALETGVQAVVAYHPPILKGVRTVTQAAEASTGLLAELLAARACVLAVHTALDAAPGGTNDVLLDAFEPVSRQPLQPRVVERLYKLVVFVPAAEVGRLRAALWAAGAGVIGHYDECSFELAGRGTFRGDETTSPTVGRRQMLETVEETRLEMVVPREKVGHVVRALYANHSYEEPAFDLYPLHELVGRGQVGMGRVGALRRPTCGDELLRCLEGRVDLSRATVVGQLERDFRSVTAAAGSFGIAALRDPQSLVLTGELKHHEALGLLRRGVTAVCLGHYASERPALEMLRARLVEHLPGVDVRVAQRDACPFRPVGSSP